MSSLHPESDFTITVTSDFIRVEHPTITSQNIFWHDIHDIAIVTTDQGPFEPDVWLVLKGDQGMIRIPQGNEAYDQVYDIVSKYEGFDFDQVIQAMMSTENQEFKVWSGNEKT